MNRGPDPIPAGECVAQALLKLSLLHSFGVSFPITQIRTQQQEIAQPTLQGLLP
jgi:hypothetical protein